PNLLAASDPERASHRAFGLPNLEFTQDETNWPYKVSMAAVKDMRIDIPGELPGPMDPIAAGEILGKKDHYEMTEADEQMMATGHGQLVGQFLLDRQGIVRWSFTEVPEGGRYMFAAPSPQELMSAVSQVAQ
ncbi:MAG: AhpC/TSA family protein, partial [Mesorhizobium sp.]